MKTVQIRLCLTQVLCNLKNPGASQTKYLFISFHHTVPFADSPPTVMNTISICNQEAQYLVFILDLKAQGEQ